MKPIRCFSFIVFLACVSTGAAQNLIIPQVADGGDWQTTLVLTNTSSSTTAVSISFFQESTGGSTQNWNLTFLETSSTQSLLIPGAGTMFLHTPDSAGATTVGWAQVQGSAAVNAYAIFTQRVPGRTDQDGTAPAATGTSRVLIPYDNTNGFVTSVALANPTSAQETLTVGIQPTTGSSIVGTAISLMPQGHTSFTMAQQFPSTAGQSGLIELYTNSGSISALALRFNPSGGFTTAPVYPESGAPITANGR